MMGQQEWEMIAIVGGLLVVFVISSLVAVIFMLASRIRRD